jgi:hypothetical protein
VALPVSVNVQVFVLFPPLEHAPDQMTSRSFVARSVIAVPIANDAEPVLPTATLIPVGVDVTRSPLRPVAVTVRVAVCGDGVTVRVAVLVTPPALAVIVTRVDAVTALVGIAKVAVVVPCVSETLAGTVAAPVLLLDSDTTRPPDGAADVRVTVPCEEVPPVTLVGFTDTVESDAGGGGGGGGVTVSVALRAVPPNEPLIARDVDAVTDAVLTVNVALKAPAGTVTLAGTVAAFVLLLDSVTTAPPEGAALVRLAVPSDVLPPTTLAGLSAIAVSEGVWVKAPGVKRRTEDQAPALPAELIPRTRHQCRRPALRVEAVNCDGVTSRSTTSGAEKLFESSIWMRYAAAAATSVQSKVTGCAGVASCAGLMSDGADGVGGGAAPVEFSKTAKLGNAPPMLRAMSGYVSPLRLAETMKMPPTLDVGGGTRYCTGAWNVPSPLPFRICITPWLPSPRLSARSWKPSPL